MPAKAICLCAHWQLTHCVRQQAGSYRFCGRLDDVDHSHALRAAGDRSHALRGNAACNAPRCGSDAERQGMHAHAEHWNDHEWHRKL